MARSTGASPSARESDAATSSAAGRASGSEEKAEAQRIPAETPEGLLMALRGGMTKRRQGEALHLGSRPLQNLARDDHALDLARALADLHELGVAVHPLDRDVATVAHATVDLDGLVRHPVRGLAR